MPLKKISLILALILILTTGCSLFQNQPKANSQQQTDDVLTEIKQLFANKYDKEADQITVTINQQTSNYMRGQVQLSPAPEDASLFLAAKIDGQWQIIHDGKGVILCSKVRQYNFPKDMIKDCYEDMQSSQLKPVNGYQGSAIAFRQYSQGKFAHGIVAQLPDAPLGKFYEGWLVNTETDEYVSTGKMNQKETGEYELVFTSDQDLKNYSQVIITEESESLGLDNKPEIHILEGEF